MSVLIGFDEARNRDRIAIRMLWTDQRGVEHIITGVGYTLSEATAQFEFAARQVGCLFNAPTIDELSGRDA
jgi:hypothetical protein